MQRNVEQAANWGFFAMVGEEDAWLSVLRRQIRFMLAEDSSISEEKQRFLRETERMVSEVLNNNQPYTALIGRLQRLEDEFPRLRSSMEEFRRSQDEFRTSIVEQFRRSQDEFRSTMEEFRRSQNETRTSLGGQVTALRADITELKADVTELKAKVYQFKSIFEGFGNLLRTSSAASRRIIWNENGFESSYPRTLNALQNLSLNDIDAILSQYEVPIEGTRRRGKHTRLRILERFYHMA